MSATMKQGGSQGSAVDRLQRARSIRVKTPNSAHSAYEMDDTKSVASQEAESTTTTTPVAFDDFYSQVDSEDEGEFDMVNPLYSHSGEETSSLYQSGVARPRISFLSLERVKRWAAEHRAPIGRVHFTPIAAEGLSTPTRSGAAIEARIRISINGQTSALEKGPKGANLKFDPKLHSLDVLYYKMEEGGELKMEDECELQVELNDVSDDSFIGAAVVSKVSAMKGTPTRIKLQLTGEGGQSAAGLLEVEISFHAYTLVDVLGLRSRSAFVEYPRDFAMRSKTRLSGLPSAVKSFLQAGLPGLGGGAGSWVVLCLCCVPFLLVTLLTNASWALRQWFLFVPLYAYVSISWPVFFAWLFGAVITAGPLHGYPGGLSIGALHISMWIRGFALHVRIAADDSAFCNPPGFPMENFCELWRLDFKGSVSLNHIWDVVTRNYKRCPLKKVPDFRLLAKFDIDYIEFENVMLDFQMYDSKFNIHEFSKLIAKNQAQNIGWMKGHCKFGEQIPNELEIRIIRAKGLVKTHSSSKARTLKDQLPAGQFGHNPVVDAFNEEFGGDSDDEAGAGSVDYGGGGPPQFNPMDASVQERKNQGSFDTYVKVTLRRDTQTTHSQTKTNSPMFNETFYFSQDDPATVVLVQVFHRQLGLSDVLLGQWIMTLKWMLGDPFYCWHEKGMQVTGDRWMRGWFPLMNKNFRGVGKCGKLEMAMQWRYVPENQLKRPVHFAPLSALAQMNENSDETRLRMGDLSRIKYWLNHEPFLYDIKRVTVRGIRFFVQDLFRGYTGRAESQGVEKSNSVEIARLDYLSEFRPKHKGDLGITTFKVVYNFFRGVAPKVLNSATSQARVGSALSQIASSASYSMGQNLTKGMQKVFRGEVDRVAPVQTVSSSVKSVTKAADKAIQLLHRTVTQNKDNETQYKFLVGAEDEDFLLPSTVLKGYVARYAVKSVPQQAGGMVTDIEMEREVARPGQFKRKYFELKGHTIFYRKNRNAPKSQLFNTTYKIELGKCVGAIYYSDKDELMLNMSEDGYFCRLKLFANEQEGGEDEAEEGGAGNPTLEEWLNALKSCGVACYSWNRGVPKA